MIRKIYFIGLLMLVMFLGVVQGDELPVLGLYEGDNLVFLSVVNEGELTLKRVGVEVRAKDLPEWVQIGELVKRIDIPKRSTGTEKLMIPMYVEGTVVGEAFELPIVLSAEDGRTWTFEVLVEIKKARPKSFALMQNAPNPFNPVTLIQYTLGGNQTVPTQLNIFNIMGQKIRTLVNEPQAPDYYSVIWNGLDDHEQKVATGVYFFKLAAGKFVKTRKMVLLK